MNIARSATVEITLCSVGGRGRFSAQLGQMQLVTASWQPFCDAARVLRGLGYPDDCLMVVRHRGGAHVSMNGLVGRARKLRVREDKNGPRFVEWEPFVSRRADPGTRNLIAGAQAEPINKH